MPKRPRNPRRGLRYGDGYVEMRRPGAAQGRWFDGERWRAKTFRAPTDEQAWQLAEDHVRLMARRHRSGQYVDPVDRTVEDLLLGWLERGPLMHDWKPYSQLTYERRVRGHLLPEFGAMRIAELDRPRVQHYVDRLAREGNSGAHIAAIIHPLRAAFREAVTVLKIAESNPTTDLQIPKKDKPQRETWSADEVALVLTALEDQALWSALYQVALTTGMRPGELRALRWGDIDRERRVIHVRRTVIRDAAGVIAVGDSPKGGEPRVVTLADATAAVALSEWRSIQVAHLLATGQRHESDYVFAIDRDGPLSNTLWWERHERLIEETGVRRITLHGLRHTAATLLLRSKVKDKIVSEMLGHSSVAITLDIYSHVDDDDLRTASDALEATILRAKSG